MLACMLNGRIIPSSPVCRRTFINLWECSHDRAAIPRKPEANPGRQGALKIRLWPVMLIYTASLQGKFVAHLTHRAHVERLRLVTGAAPMGVQPAGTSPITKWRRLPAVATMDRLPVEARSWPGFASDSASGRAPFEGMAARSILKRQVAARNLRTWAISSPG